MSCQKCGGEHSTMACDDEIERPRRMSGSSFAAPSGSEATWKRLAIQIAEQAEVVLQNAHWEVSYGSGDLRNTIKAVRRMQYTGSEMPPNDKLRHSAPAKDSDNTKNV